MFISVSEQGRGPEYLRKKYEALGMTIVPAEGENTDIVIGVGDKEMGLTVGLGKPLSKGYHSIVLGDVVTSQRSKVAVFVTPTNKAVAAVRNISCPTVIAPGSTEPLIVKFQVMEDGTELPQLVNLFLMNT